MPKDATAKSPQAAPGRRDGTELLQPTAATVEKCCWWVRALGSAWLTDWSVLAQGRVRTKCHKILFVYKLSCAPSSTRFFFCKRSWIFKGLKLAYQTRIFYFTPSVTNVHWIAHWGYKSLLTFMLLHIQQEGVTDELANWSSILHSHNKMGQPRTGGGTCSLCCWQGRSRCLMVYWVTPQSSTPFPEENSPI